MSIQEEVGKERKGERFLLSKLPGSRVKRPA